MLANPSATSRLMASRAGVRPSLNCLTSRGSSSLVPGLRLRSMIFDLIRSTAFSVSEVFGPASLARDLPAAGGFPRRFACTDGAFVFFMRDSAADGGHCRHVCEAGGRTFGRMVG